VRIRKIFPFTDLYIFCPISASVEGFVMDQFCIERGTLLDKPDLSTLQFPDEHSLHWYVLNLCILSSK
jgi:hypothetical protein